jgi:signal transduction histidine kinase
MTQVTEKSEALGGERQDLRHALHELSNIMTGLLMNTGLLSIALRGNDKLRRYAEDIAQAGERGAALVREARNLVNHGTSGEKSELPVTLECDGQPDDPQRIDFIHMPPISRRTQ